MQPILSICIPTYNRANWLRSSLWNWLPQVNVTNGLVELIVCDNASSDRTKEVINEANNWGEFQYYCNSENIGPVRNIYRLVNELAKGKFIWVVGDDDLPSIDTVQRVVNVLQNKSNVNYIYANYSYWNPKKDLAKELLDSRNLDFSQTFSLDSETKFVNQLSELVIIDHNCFTPVYCSIMRRQDACNAFKIGIEGMAFSSIETTIPHAVFIAKNLLNQSAWYIGKPCMLASHDISWSDFATLYWIEYIPMLYKLLETHGGNKLSTRSHIKKIKVFIFNLINTSRSSNISINNKLYLTLRFYKNYPFSMVILNELGYLLSVFRFQIGLGAKSRFLLKKLNVFRGCLKRG